MAGRNKMLKGMMIGAVVGAAVSLLDDETRKSTIKNMKTCKNKLQHHIKEPGKLIDFMSNKVSNLSHSIRNISEESQYILDQLNQLTVDSQKVFQKMSHSQSVKKSNNMEVYK